MRGAGQLGEHAADYVICYQDGTEERVPIRRRYEIGAFQRGWGENCFLAVAAHKSQPTRAHHEQMSPDWGRSQTRALQFRFSGMDKLAVGLGKSRIQKKPIVGVRI